jgi:hypothetical protein
MYVQLPEDNADRGSLLRKVLMGVHGLGDDAKNKVYSALSYIDVQEPGLVDKMLATRNAKEAEKVTQIKAGLKLIKAGMHMIKDELRLIGSIDLEDVKDVNAAEIATSKRQYIAAIESIRSDAEKLLKMFPGETPEAQANINRDYNKLMRRLDHMVEDVEGTFGKFLKKDSSGNDYSEPTKNRALATKEELKHTVSHTTLDLVAMVNVSNADMLKQGKEQLLSGIRPSASGVVLDEGALGTANKACTFLTQSGDAGALSGRASIAEYTSTRSAFQMLALQTSWQFKDVLLGGEVLKDKAGEAVGHYSAMTGQFVGGVWDQIQQHAKGTVEKVLAENRKYFQWLDKYVEKKKEAQKEEDKTILAQKTEELKAIVAETEELGDSPIRKNMRELAKEELIRKKLSSTSMDAKNS